MRIDLSIRTMQIGSLQTTFLRNEAEELYTSHCIWSGQAKKELSDLRKEMHSSKISKLRPFGDTLQRSLDNAKFDDNDGYALWVEEDYCSPPLAMERESVLDRYFNDIIVERVESKQVGCKFATDSARCHKIALLLR
jgi:hypothetical protein